MSRPKLNIIGGKATAYVKYNHPLSGETFEIEHIWADKFEENKDEFEQESDVKIICEQIWSANFYIKGINI